MIANFNSQNSTSMPRYEQGTIVVGGWPSITIIGSDGELGSQTTRTLKEAAEITLNYRTYTILQEQEKKEKEELKKQKPQKKWYRQFQKHKKWNKFV